MKEQSARFSFPFGARCFKTRPRSASDALVDPAPPPRHHTIGDPSSTAQTSFFPYPPPIWPHPPVPTTAIIDDGCYCAPPPPPPPPPCPCDCFEPTPWPPIATTAINEDGWSHTMALGEDGSWPWQGFPFPRALPAQGGLDLSGLIGGPGSVPNLSQFLGGPALNGSPDPTAANPFGFMDYNTAIMQLLVMSSYFKQQQTSGFDKLFPIPSVAYPPTQGGDSFQQLWDLISNPSSLVPPGSLGAGSEADAILKAFLGSPLSTSTTPTAGQNGPATPGAPPPPDPRAVDPVANVVTKPLADVRQQNPFSRVGGDPIILDLDKSWTPDVSGGVVAPHPDKFDASRTVQFDINGDGTLDTVEWVGPNDGLLVYDQTGDLPNRIAQRNSMRLSGNQLPTYADLQRLGLDANGDGTLTGDELSHLKVWVDRNSNGITEWGELLDMSTLNIDSFSLRPDAATGETYFHSGTGGELRTWEWWPSFQ